MNVYRIYLLLIDLVQPFIVSLFRTKRGRRFVFTLTPLLMIDKKGEKYFSIYACFEKSIYVYAYMFCFANRRKRKNLMSFMFN